MKYKGIPFIATKTEQKRFKNQSKEVLSLDEAIDLWTKGYGIEKNDNGKLHFLSAAEVLKYRNQLKDESYCQKSFVGSNIYAIRKPNKQKLEMVHLGNITCARSAPLRGNFFEQHRILSQKIKFREKDWKKLYNKYLTISDHVLEYYDKEELNLEENMLPPLYTRNLFHNDEEFQTFLQSLNQDDPGFTGISPYFDKNWKLGVISILPRAKVRPIEIDVPHPDQKVALEYIGDHTLDQAVLKYVVQPKNIGNGVIVMNEDRIPKYLQRTLGLKGGN